MVPRDQKHLAEAKPSPDHRRSASIIGNHNELRNAIARELTDNKVQVAVADCAVSDAAAVIDSIRGSPADMYDTRETGPDSIVIVTACPRSPRARRGLCNWRTRVADRAEQQRLTDLAVSALTSTSNCRLLVVCDASRGTAPSVAIRWARHLAVGVDYEARVNGASVISTSYLIVRSSMSVSTAARLVAQCHHRSSA